VKTLVLVLSFFCVYTLNAQIKNYNLKNLDNISVEVYPEQGLIDSETHQKIVTEIKLNLMSAGIKVLPPEESSAKLIINVEVIPSKISEHRIFIRFNIYENVSVDREKRITTTAITYNDNLFFTDRDISQSVCDKVLDVMIIKFIEQYIAQNK
jgi:hypothetical protein